MLEQPKKSGAKVLSHMLSSHGGQVFIHLLSAKRSILEDAPSISEGNERSKLFSNSNAQKIFFSLWHFSIRFELETQSRDIPRHTWSKSQCNDLMRVEMISMALK